MRVLDWYFDFISPFAYLQQEHFHWLPDDVTVRCKPVLFAGLLRHWGTKGPAEIPARRLFTYRHLLWTARRHGLAFKMPPAHPFNPLKALRLAIALDCRQEVVRDIFRFYWRDGHASDDPLAWAELLRQLGAEDAETKINNPAVKETLRRNTEEAIAAGVFGVPTFLVDDELFWGFDATGMVLDYLQNPRLFDEPEMARISALPEGVRRSL